MQRKTTFPRPGAFHCLGLREPECYPALSSRGPKGATPKGLAQSDSLRGGSPPSIAFQVVFIMTRVDHSGMANAIRALAMDAVEKAKPGHPDLPMGAADVATVLFTQFLKFDAANPRWPDRDRFILSAGHGSMLLYALLYLTGNAEMTLDEIRNFRQLGSKTPGHPKNFIPPGIETPTGPLGQGGRLVGRFCTGRTAAGRGI